MTKKFTDKKKNKKEGAPSRASDEKGKIDDVDADGGGGDISAFNPFFVLARMITGDCEEAEEIRQDLVAKARGKDTILASIELAEGLYNSKAAEIVDEDSGAKTWLPYPGCVHENFQKDASFLRARKLIHKHNKYSAAKAKVEKLLEDCLNKELYPEIERRIRTRERVFPRSIAAARSVLREQDRLLKARGEDEEDEEEQDEEEQDVGVKKKNNKAQTAKIEAVRDELDEKFCNFVDACMAEGFLQVEEPMTPDEMDEEYDETVALFDSDEEKEEEELGNFIVDNDDDDDEEDEEEGETSDPKARTKSKSSSRNDDSQYEPEDSDEEDDEENEGNDSEEEQEEDVDDEDAEDEGKSAEAEPEDIDTSSEEDDE